MTDDVPQSIPSPGSRAGWLARLFRRRSGASPEIARTVAEVDRAHALSDEQRAMLSNLLDLGALDVSDVMVPRADIVAVPATAGIAELLRVFREAGHSRLPVYNRDLDDIVGMVHVKDLLPYWSNGKDFRLRQVRRDVLVTAPSSPVADLLRRMRAAKSHMAMVVDEHGGTDGLVTIEDLVEEIVGEIEDEHDRDSLPVLRRGSDGEFLADARVPLENLEEATGSALRPGRGIEVETVGGLVVTLAGRVPVPGQSVIHGSGYRFTVLDADRRRVRRIRVARVESS